MFLPSAVALWNLKKTAQKLGRFSRGGKTGKRRPRKKSIVEKYERVRRRRPVEQKNIIYPS